MQSVLNRWLTLSIVFAAVVVGAMLTPRDGTAQVRDVSLQELTQASTSVVLGTTTRKVSYWDEGSTKILTNVTIRVDEAVKGEASREFVITIPGGQVGNTLYEVSDMPVFVEGKEILVFLWRHPTGRTLVTGGMQGKLDVVEETSSGRKVVPGASRLLEAGIAGKVAPTARARNGSILLDDVLSAIRSSSQ